MLTKSGMLSIMHEDTTPNQSSVDTSEVGKECPPSANTADPASHANGNSTKRVRARNGIFADYLGVAGNVLVHPKQFFDDMATDEGYLQPSMFLLISAVFYSALQAIGHLNLLLLITTPFISFLKVVVGSLVLNFALKALGGKGSLQGTFRVLAYSKATLLFAWIVVGKLAIGGFISLIYTLYLNIQGCRRVHLLDTVRVSVVVVILALIGFKFFGG